jgi:hypothetical protein
MTAFRELTLVHGRRVDFFRTCAHVNMQCALHDLTLLGCCRGAMLDEAAGPHPAWPRGTVAVKQLPDGLDVPKARLTDGVSDATVAHRPKIVAWFGRTIWQRPLRALTCDCSDIPCLLSPECCCVDVRV